MAHKHHGKKHHHHVEHHGNAKNAKVDQEKEHGEEGGSLTAHTGKKGKMNRTGEITHGMTALLPSVKSKDHHASKEFHEHNKHHGMEKCFHPPESASGMADHDPEGNYC